MSFPICFPMIHRDFLVKLTVKITVKTDFFFFFFFFYEFSAKSLAQKDQSD